jgi:hypothetical protein
MGILVAVGGMGVGVLVTVSVGLGGMGVSVGVLVAVGGMSVFVAVGVGLGGIGVFVAVGITGVTEAGTNVGATVVLAPIGSLPHTSVPFR